MISQHERQFEFENFCGDACECFEIGWLEIGERRAYPGKGPSVRVGEAWSNYWYSSGSTSLVLFYTIHSVNNVDDLIST